MFVVLALSVGRFGGVEVGAEAAEGSTTRAITTSGNVKSSAFEFMLLPFEEIRTRSELLMVKAPTAAPAATCSPTVFRQRDFTKSTFSDFG